MSCSPWRSERDCFIERDRKEIPFDFGRVDPEKINRKKSAVKKFRRGFFCRRKFIAEIFCCNFLAVCFAETEKIGRIFLIVFFLMKNSILHLPIKTSFLHRKFHAEWRIFFARLKKVILSHRSFSDFFCGAFFGAGEGEKSFFRVGRRSERCGRRSSKNKSKDEAQR